MGIGFSDGCFPEVIGDIARPVADEVLRGTRPPLFADRAVERLVTRMNSVAAVLRLARHRRGVDRRGRGSQTMAPPAVSVLRPAASAGHSRRGQWRHAYGIAEARLVGQGWGSRSGRHRRLHSLAPSLLVLETSRSSIVPVATEVSLIEDLQARVCVPPRARPPPSSHGRSAARGNAEFDDQPPRRDFFHAHRQTRRSRRARSPSGPGAASRRRLEDLEVGQAPPSPASSFPSSTAAPSSECLRRARAGVHLPHDAFMENFVELQGELDDEEPVVDDDAT